MLSVPDAAGYIRFLSEAFGGVELGRTDGENGKIAHAQVKIGDTPIMLSDSVPQFPPSVSTFYLYVEDADAAMKKAVDAGATVNMKVADAVRRSTRRHH